MALTRGLGMPQPAMHTLLLAPLLLLLLLPPEPTDAWYKHAATPNFHTVGRAAGLLLGLRRSPPVWRHGLSPAAATELDHAPRRGPLAGKDNAPSLPSGVQAPRGSSQAEVPVGAARNRRVLEEPRAGAASWSWTEEGR